MQVFTLHRSQSQLWAVGQSFPVHGVPRPGHPSVSARLLETAVLPDCDVSLSLGNSSKALWLLTHWLGTISFSCNFLHILLSFVMTTAVRIQGFCLKMWDFKIWFKSTAAKVFSEFWKWVFSTTTMHHVNSKGKAYLAETQEHPQRWSGGCWRHHRTEQSGLLSLRNLCLSTLKLRTQKKGLATPGICSNSR